MSDALKIPFWSVYFAHYFFTPHQWRKKWPHLIASIVGAGTLIVSASVPLLLAFMIVLNLIIGFFIVTGQYTDDSAIS